MTLLPTLCSNTEYKNDDDSTSDSLFDTEDEHNDDCDQTTRGSYRNDSEKGKRPLNTNSPKSGKRRRISKVLPKPRGYRPVAKGPLKQLNVPKIRKSFVSEFPIPAALHHLLPRPHGDHQRTLERKGLLYTTPPNEIDHSVDNNDSSGVNTPSSDVVAAASSTIATVKGPSPPPPNQTTRPPFRIPPCSHSRLTDCPEHGHIFGKGAGYTPDLVFAVVKGIVVSAWPQEDTVDCIRLLEVCTGRRLDYTKAILLRVRSV